MLTASDVKNQPGSGIDHLIGDRDRPILTVGPIGSAGAGCLSFAAASACADAIAELMAGVDGAILVCSATVADAVGADRTTLLVAENPRLAFLRAVRNHFALARPSPGIHPTAAVDPSAEVDPTAHVGAFCSIGAGCRIGAGTVIHSHVALYSGVRVGRNVTINSGTVIGADGFGYEKNESGELEKFPHIGGVVIEDDVEIGSNTSIDRGTLGDTLLKRGARIDNQIHIAHNVVVGRDSAVIAQAMIGGSVKIGDRAWIAPAAVIIDRVSIGSDTLVGLSAV